MVWRTHAPPEDQRRQAPSGRLSARAGAGPGGLAGFGKSGGGGRRGVERRPAPLSVALSTLSRNFTGTLLDISRGGARVRLATPPDAGQALYLTFGSLRLFGTVCWNTGDQCGLTFDEEISQTELSRVMIEALRTRDTTPEILAAREEWERGRG